MVFVNARVVGGVLDQQEKRRLIEGITDLVDEIEPGMLGVGGQGLTTEDVRQAQG